MTEKKYDAIVLGGGPAGLTAAIYLSRGKVKTAVIDTGTIGGQMILTHEIANYPGVENIGGFMLAMNMQKQAKSFGTDIKSNAKILSFNLEGDEKYVIVGGREEVKYSAKTIIIATGGRSRNLNVPGETDFQGRGISYCATCDGDFFQDKEIIVVGGGNSALEEANALTTYASRVTVLHEFDHFQAFEQIVKEAKANPKIDYIMESHIVEFFGEEKLSGVKIKNLKTGEIHKRKTDGVFVFIGYIPNTEVFKDTNLEIDRWNQIVATPEMKTNIDGVFVAGDCRAKRRRQVTTAVADGTIAALSAIDYLNS